MTSEKMSRKEIAAALLAWEGELNRFSMSVTRAFSLVQSDSARTALLEDIAAISRERRELEDLAHVLWKQDLLAQATNAAAINFSTGGNTET